jgi:hypothetical protein
MEMIAGLARHGPDHASRLAGPLSVSVYFSAGQIYLQIVRRMRQLEYRHSCLNACFNRKLLHTRA